MKERLNKAFYHLKSIGLISKQDDLADKMSFSRTSISKAMNGYEDYLTESFMRKLNIAYPDIFNLNWLLTGEGSMLKSGNKDLIINDPKIISIDEGQPILDIRICAGQGIGLFGDENKVLSRVNIPDFKGCVGVIVYGESMYDKYAPGDAVFVREISNCNYIENGQPYVVITKEDRLLKLVYQENDKLTLVSYNTVLNPDGRRTFPDMPINPDDILYIYKVVGKLARNQI